MAPVVDVFFEHSSGELFLILAVIEFAQIRCAEIPLRVRNECGLLELEATVRVSVVDIEDFDIRPTARFLVNKALNPLP